MPFQAASRWYQHVDWAKHTTVLAALVAAVGLGVTAWGTLMSARVAQDQLGQSTEQRTERSMSQASRITAWVEKDTTVVANRSLDPADVYLNVWPSGAPSRTIVQGHDAPDSELVGVRRDVYIGTVPPCLRLSIPGDFLRSRLHDQHHLEIDPKRPGLYLKSILIFDANGQAWKRQNGIALAPASDAEAEYAESMAFEAWKPVPLPAAKTKGLEDCGSST
ncbi:hypothetical protein ACFVAQ_35535 [Streptomyces sp. NPDC057651]|uniref:hypothetical protein n=1 Tax=Streptomyces sp. NPDC057651 TaxID=3346194 RepID=UPI0036C22E5E